MKILNVEPRTPAWLKVRNESWTASLAPVLVVKQNAILLQDYARQKNVTLDIQPLLAVGLDEHFGQTLWSTWAHRTGLIPRYSEAKRNTPAGESVEFVIREFEKSNLLVCQRAFIAQATGNDWMAASFDAMVPKSSDPIAKANYGFPLLAKSPTFPTRRKLWDSRKAGYTAIRGLPSYWCELQHQLFVAEAPYGWFAAIGAEQNKSTGKPAALYPLTERIPRDDAFLAAYVAAAQFYHSEFLLDLREPPKLPADEILKADLMEKVAIDAALETGDYESAVSLFLEAKAAEEVASNRRKLLQERLVSKARLMKSKEAGVVNLTPTFQVTFSEPTAVAWERVAEALAKQLGKDKVPTDVITAWTSQPKESVKLKEV